MSTDGRATAGSEGGDGSDESVARRVRKLLDKAERTANPHEAEAFSRKAAELAARHRIDPDRLRTGAGGSELSIRKFPLGRGPYVRGRLALLTAVADAHDVRVVFHQTPEGTEALAAGFGDDLEIIETLYHSLHQQASTQMANRRRGTAAATQRHRRAFLFGYASRIADLLAEAAREANAAGGDGPAGGAQQSVDLALRERAEAVDEFASREWGRVRAARRVSPVEGGGWAAGSDAAGRADLGRRRVEARLGLPKGAA